MTERPDPIPSAVADQNNIGPEPKGVAGAAKTDVERIVGIVKDIVQTVGILAAGIFAVVKFGILVTVRDQPLVHLYRSDASSHHTFEWFVPRKPNAIAVFQIWAFDSGTNPTLLDGQTQWDLVCGEDAKGSVKKPEKSTRLEAIR